jgi:hypothetical protein
MSYLTTVEADLIFYILESDCDSHKDHLNCCNDFIDKSNYKHNKDKKGVFYWKPKKKINEEVKQSEKFFKLVWRKLSFDEYMCFLGQQREQAYLAYKEIKDGNIS